MQYLCICVKISHTFQTLHRLEVFRVVYIQRFQAIINTTQLQLMAKSQIKWVVTTL